MNFEILKAESFEVKNWRGGTTTQLFIFPKTANYLAINLKFRLSTAKVLVEKSDFTILPKVHRQLMVLDGQIKLKHEHQHSKILKKFDCAQFDGALKTSSVGICTDFNLMTTNKIKGKLKSVLIPKNESLDYLINKSNQWQFIYVYQGALEIGIKANNYQLNQGDLLVLTDCINQTLGINANDYCELVLVTILSE